MWRRRYWLAAILVAVLAIAALGVYLGRHYPPGPGVRWANVDRITPGMTKSEVEAVIGYPPQTWWHGPEPITDQSPADYHTVLMWSDTACDILVYLDRDGRVIGREGVGGRPLSWYDRVRQRLRL